MTPGIDQKLKALEAFKDWSNYLLVTTVAALGWTSAKTSAGFSGWIRGACILMLAVSVVFGILTLALIPHIGESLTEHDQSIYAARWQGWLGGRYELMDFCFLQHVLFLLGIVFYGGGMAIQDAKRSGWGIFLTISTVLFILGLMWFFIWKHR